MSGCAVLSLDLRVSVFVASANAIVILGLPCLRSVRENRKCDFVLVNSDVAVAEVKSAFDA